jgi:hypothetical protein
MANKNMVEVSRMYELSDVEQIRIFADTKVSQITWDCARCEITIIMHKTGERVTLQKYREDKLINEVLRGMGLT